MRILYLTNKDALIEKKIIETVKSAGDELQVIRKRFYLDEVKDKFDFIISDRARFLITEDIINNFKKKIINFHPSFLPWCRGYYPNYWSIKKNLPHGVTIHYIDKDIDSGEILLQKKINYSPNDTLKSTHDRLRNAMLDLFKNNWKKIRDKKIKSFPQNNSVNSIFYLRDFKGIYENLPNGWDTKVTDL